LANINEINDSFFSEKLDNNTKLEYLDKEIKENEKNFSVGSIVDIVLNHTSDNSDWIADHPECGYNLENSPWLNCAYDLDKTLADFSKDFIECKTKLKFQPFINNENDLNITMGEIDKVIKQRNLYEYFNIDLEKNLKKYEEIFDDYKKDNNKYKINKYHTKNEDDYFYNNCIDKLGEERNGVEIIEQNLLNLLLDNKIEKETFLKKLKSLILNFNNKWQQNSNNMLNSALGNIRKEIHENYLENINPY
jgi:glycogen debranching enzyme